MRLLIATTNPGKLAEIAEILEGLPIELDTLAACPGVPVAVEHGVTFAENAREKALHYARATGAAVVAEDSGLEIDALGGRPGIHSARYNGETHAEKFRALYAELAATGPGRRTARFVCALAMAGHQDGGRPPSGGPQAIRILFETTGIVEGEIAPAPRGERGFGYDPIFYYPQSGRTFGELEPAEKTRVSHRGRAFQALREYLEKSVAGR